MDDYIKRSDAQDMVHLYAITVDKTDTLSSVLRNIIRDIPPADVRPVVRGEWIKRNPSNELDGDYYCSACGHEIDIADGSITPFDVGLKFCPNCGAYMRPDTTDN